MEKLDGILRERGKEKRGKEEKSVRSNGAYIIIARYSVRKERGLISTTIKFSIRTGTYAYIIFVLFERR